MNSTLLDTLSIITPEEEAIHLGRKHIDKALYNLKTAMIIDYEKLIDSNSLIQVRQHTRFIHFPKHTHNYVEIAYMCSGETHHIVNNQDIH